MEDAILLTAMLRQLSTAVGQSSYTEEYFNSLQITADGNGAIRLCDYVSVTTNT